MDNEGSHRGSSGSSKTCCACLESEGGSGYRQLRPRTESMVRAFVEETGIANKFPGPAVLSNTLPLVLCKRAGCLLNLYDKRMRILSKERIARKLKRVPAARTKWTGTPEPVLRVQRHRLDRYCTSDAAVEVLLDAVDISGRVLDMCGGPGDAVARLLGATCELVTNDVSDRLSPGSKKAPDTHLDASATTFCADFLEDGTQQRPDWVVTSPPYKGAFKFVKAALSIAEKGVALKLPLSFLEPCADRGAWLSANPPALCVFLRRAKYTPAQVMVGEFWGVWYNTRVDATAGGGSKLLFCP